MGGRQTAIVVARYDSMIPGTYHVPDTYVPHFMIPGTYYVPYTYDTRYVSVSYTHLRAHETDSYLVCRLLLEKKKSVRVSKTIVRVFD